MATVLNPTADPEQVRLAHLTLQSASDQNDALIAEFHVVAARRKEQWIALEDLGHGPDSPELQALLDAHRVDCNRIDASTRRLIEATDALSTALGNPRGACIQELAEFRRLAEAAFGQDD